MTNKELKTFILSLGIHKKKYKIYLENHHPDILKEIFDHTKFLDESYCSNHNIRFTERIYCIFNDLSERPICPNCGKHHVDFNRTLGVYRGYCSRDCARRNENRLECARMTTEKRYGSRIFVNTDKARETRRKRYNGKWEPKSSSEKRKKTLLDRYGNENYVNLGEMRRTCIQRYGVEYPQQLKEIQIKQIESFRKNHPCMTNVMQLPGMRDKINDGTRMRSWKFILNDKDVIPNFDFEYYKSIKSLNRDTRLEFICRKCGRKFISFWDNGTHLRCPECYQHGISSGELDMIDLLRKEISPLGWSVFSKDRRNRKICSPKEIDILIYDNNDSIRLGIEYDGLYYHSSERRPKEYHLEKTIACESNGFPLIHVFEDEWIMKRETVMNNIRLKLGLLKNHHKNEQYIIDVIPHEITSDFHDHNSLLQQKISDIDIGIKTQTDLISYASFRRPRKNGIYGWTMSNFVVENGRDMSDYIDIVLLKFHEITGAESVTAKFDMRWFSKNEFPFAGFKTEKIESPEYWYFFHSDPTTRIDRKMMQKPKLRKFLTNYDETLSEYENMKNNGYLRIYDCGQLVAVRRFI